MIPPESAGWANLKSKAACCQAATNLVDRDWELLIWIDYRPYPNCTTFTKLGYPVFSHIQVDVALPLAKKIQCNACKDLSNDFASRSFVGWLSESPSPKYNVNIVLITQNWYITYTLSNLNVIRRLQQAYKYALFYPGLWSYQSRVHNLWSHLRTKLAKI